MKTILHNALLTGASLALVASSLSVAQTAAGQSQQSQAQAQSGALPDAVVRGRKLDNAKVFTPQGEQMGTIEDVLLDPKTGRITHAVLGIGGWLGIGEKRVIVPWQLVQQDFHKPENFVVNVDKEKLRGAPSFEGDQWAAVTQPDYLKKVQSYFGLPVQEQQPSGAVAQQPPQQPQQGQQGQQAQQAQQEQQEQQKQAQQSRQQANQQAQEAAQRAQQQAEQAKQQAQQAQQNAQKAEERAKQTQQAAQQTQQQLQQQGAQVGTPQQ